MNHAPRIFHSLKGNWIFHRIISSHGTIEGTATFSRGSSENCLHYKEEGVFFDGSGKTYDTFREYFYQLDQDQISVYFCENPLRLFHTLSFVPKLKIPTATASHLCKCDTYDAVYTFSAPDAFSLCYTIKGPQKDYCIQTDFKR